VTHKNLFDLIVWVYVAQLNQLKTR